MKAYLSLMFYRNSGSKSVCLPIKNAKTVTKRNVRKKARHQRVLFNLRRNVDDDDDDDDDASSLAQLSFLNDQLADSNNVNI